jgi:hypothetical protein
MIPRYGNLKINSEIITDFKKNFCGNSLKLPFQEN